MSLLGCAAQEIRKLPFSEISRIADPRRTAIFFIGGFREKLRIAGVGHKPT